MFEYAFGFLVGAVTMYLAYRLQFEKLDKMICTLDQRLDIIEAQQNRLMKVVKTKIYER